MALYDDATLNISIGRFYLSPVGTAKPLVSALGTIATPWNEIGHTSVDNVLSSTSSGGDQTTLSTLQSRNLRTTTAPRSEAWNITIEQFDEASLKLYFGANAVTNEGWLDVPNAPTNTEVAFLAVLTDGGQHLGIWAPKVEIKRGDDWSFADTSSLSGLPLTITPLSLSGGTSDWSITPLVPASTPVL